MGSALIDRRTARLAVGLAIAGSLMLTAGLGIWAVSALSHAIPPAAHTVAWLAAVALLTAGVCCGVLMIVVLLGASRNGRAAPTAPSWPDGRARGPRPPGTLPRAAQTPGPPRLPTGPPPFGPPPAVPRPPADPPAGPPPGPGAPPDPDEWSASAADEWSGPAEYDWAATDDGLPADPRLAPDEWPAADGDSAPQPEPADGGWPASDTGRPPGAVLGPGGWAAPDPDGRPDDWPAEDPGLPPAGEPALHLWPSQAPAPHDAGPGLSSTAPAAEWTAEDDEPADGPAHRVESEFNVWQRPDPDAAPDAGPSAPVPGPAADEWVQPGADEWVQPGAARLPDADLLPDPDPRPGPDLRPGADLRPDADVRPDADLLPAAGLLPPAPELLAGPAEPVAEPLDALDLTGPEPDPDPIRRPATPRRSTSPAPGWNPDSEDDWLRVLRGLRASEDS